MITSRNRYVVALLAVAFLGATACGKGDQPANSDAATPPRGKTAAAPHESAPRVETGVVDYSGLQQDLSLAGKIAYGEDKYSKISSPLQGRVVEVRADIPTRS